MTRASRRREVRVMRGRGSVIAAWRIGAVALVAVVAACTSVAPPSAPTPTGAVATPTAVATVPSSTPATATARAPVPRTAVEIDRGNPDRRELALTFDCAAGSGPTDEILRVLREEDVSATFFMVGIWARDHPALTKEIAQRHELANHSWAHPDYRDLSAAEIAADLEQNEAFLLALTGKSTKPLWRAPSGARDQRVLEAAAAAGWPIHVFWTIASDAQGTANGESGDWREIAAPEVYANMLRAAALGGGVITVSHCDSPATAAVLRDMTRALRGMGLRIVTVSELLRSEPQAGTPQAGTPR